VGISRKGFLKALGFGILGKDVWLRVDVDPAFLKKVKKV
jgi:hypothetical protein